MVSAVQDEIPLHVIMDENRKTLPGLVAWIG